MTATLDTLSFHIEVLEDMLLGSHHYSQPSSELEDVFERRRFASNLNEPLMDPAALVVLMAIAERWQDGDGDHFGWGLSVDQCDFFQFLESQPGEGPYEACLQALHASVASIRGFFDVDSRLQWLWMTLEVKNFAVWECIWAAVAGGPWQDGFRSYSTRLVTGRRPSTNSGTDSRNSRPRPNAS